MNRITVGRMMVEARKVFSDEIWELPLDGFSLFKKRLVQFIKLMKIVFNEFAKNRMGFQCVALSYFGALAVIPLVAFVFAVSGGLGLEDKLRDMLFSYIPTDPEFLNVIMDKAGNIIDTAQSSGVGLISALLFFWTVIWLMFQVERVFNNVWGIRKIPRKIYLRFSFYLGALLLTPFLVMLFGTGIALYSNVTSLIGISIHIKDVSFFVSILGHFVMFVFAVFLFTIMYKYIPATFVSTRSAFWSALVAAFIFVIFQHLYLHTQAFMSRLNGVYGAIAAIPLFLMWMNYSWQIIIYGAQLCYGLQHIDDYNIPEGRLQDFTPMRDRLKKEFEEDILEEQK
ncbi:MAG: YihY/virulence factor BrkB family protein [Bacteroidales bacterium]|nr:YihY/virulence factor BrkB family protein [Bacteroidales bacterium]